MWKINKYIFLWNRKIKSPTLGLSDFFLSSVELISKNYRITSFQGSHFVLKGIALVSPLVLIRIYAFKECLRNLELIHEQIIKLSSKTLLTWKLWVKFKCFCSMINIIIENVSFICLHLLSIPIMTQIVLCFKNEIETSNYMAKVSLIEFSMYWCTCIILSTFELLHSKSSLI